MKPALVRGMAAGAVSICGALLLWWTTGDPVVATAFQVGFCLGLWFAQGGRR